jgi:hypothetical protein
MKKSVGPGFFVCVVGRLDFFVVDGQALQPATFQIYVSYDMYLDKTRRARAEEK